MIDIVTNNVRQVGAPSEEDRIYISDKAYRRVKTQEFSEKRVFVFMGHTESSGGRYATFIEEAINVTEITFEHNLPIWTNKVWSEVFREIKRDYDELIIVGWALDLRGYSPKVTPELQKIHREHFGGAHQLLMLVDSMQSEEAFYLNRGGKLTKREGFFIYYKVEDSKPKKTPQVELEIPDSMMELRRQKLQAANIAPEPRYRYAVTDRRKKKIPIKGMAVAVALVAIIGIGTYNKYFQAAEETSAFDKVQVIEINKNDKNIIDSTERDSEDAKMIEKNSEKDVSDEKSTETVKVIPVEKVPQQ